MKNYSLILKQDVPTPVMRALAKYLKSQGYQVPDEVTGGGILKIQGLEEKKTLDLVLQNYIGSAQVQEIHTDEN